MRVPDYPSADADRWSAVDGYFAELLAPSNAQLEATLAKNASAGLPPHDVSALQGKMLALFNGECLARSRNRHVGWLQHDLDGKCSARGRLRRDD
jgi:hypothetical protein